MKTLTSILVTFSTMVLLVASTECKTKKTITMQDKDFIECSRNEGDLGCDSCYYRIYGKLINPFTGESEEVVNPDWIKAHKDYINSLSL